MPEFYFALFDLIQALEYKDVIIRHLPHVEGLRTENLLEFLINDCEGLDFLPAKYENINLYRDWVGNICMLIWFYNTIGNSLQTILFGDYVEDKLYRRQQHITQNKWLSIQVLPKFVKLFDSSHMVSSKFNSLHALHSS